MTKPTSQLDGLRGIAILLVLTHHFFHLSKPLGNVGVRIFFGISGFLITGILLHARKQVEEQGVPLGHVVRTFYCRRILRLVPAFYVMLALAWAVDIRPARETLEWHVTGLTNVLIVLNDDFIGPLTHLWSLASEEQFYLVWPAVVLLTPTRRLGVVMVGLVVAGPVFRMTAFAMGWPRFINVVTPFAVLDCLAVGALAALWTSRGALDAVQRLRLIGLSAGVAGASVAYGFYSTTTSLTKLVAFDVSMAFVAVALATGARAGFGGVTGRILAFWPLVYTGRISYGLYLFHNFAPGAVNMVWPESPSVAKIALFYGLSFTAAVASWHFIEQPINDLRRHFPYRPQSGNFPTLEPATPLLARF